MSPPPPFHTLPSPPPDKVDPSLEDPSAPSLFGEDISHSPHNVLDVPSHSSSLTTPEDIPPALYAYIDLITAVDEDISTTFDDYINAYSGAGTATPVSNAHSNGARIPAHLKGKVKHPLSLSPPHKVHHSRRLNKSPSPPARICNRCLPLLCGTIKMQNSKNTHNLAPGCAVLSGKKKCERCFIQKQQCSFMNTPLLPHQYASHLATDPSQPSQCHQVRNVVAFSPSSVIKQSPSLTPSHVSVTKSVPPTVPSPAPSPENFSTLVLPPPSRSPSTAIVAYPNILVTLWNINDRRMVSKVPMSLQQGSDYMANNPPDLDSLQGTSVSELLLTRNTLFQASDAILDSISLYYVDYG
ncbi:hypothetical protein C8J56DRAFT_1065422 [Mycena floridula]|nr:hypothetical protein C8J56DRAFT_1065422 [Mycena floridula]